MRIKFLTQWFAPILIAIAFGCDSGPAVEDDSQDTTPPLVAIIFPSSNVVVGDNINIQCEATDASTIVRYEYVVDGVAVGETLSSCEFAWDTRNVANGTHSLVVRATDDAGNTGQSSTVSFVVDNDPESVLIVAVCIEDAPYVNASGEPWDEDGDPDWSVTLINSLGVCRT